MLKAVIFDIDGTLLDSVDQHAESWKLTFERFGLSIPFAEIRSQIGKGGDKLLENFLTDQEIKSNGKQMTKYRGELFVSQFLNQVKPFPYVPELLERVRNKGRRTALATSASNDEVKKYQRILGIESLVDAVTTMDDVENSKPNPDVLQALRGQLNGLSASECVFIGDTPYDVEAAVKDGMRAMAVLCGGFQERDLRTAGAHSIYQDPEDLYRRWEMD